MPILISRTDGGVSIMYPGSDFVEEVEIQKWKGLHVGEYVSHRTASLSEIPKDRTYRNSWKPDMTIDPIKSKQTDDEKEIESLKSKVINDLVTAEKAKKK